MEGAQFVLECHPRSLYAAPSFGGWWKEMGFQQFWKLLSQCLAKEMLVSSGSSPVCLMTKHTVSASGCV